MASGEDLEAEVIVGQIEIDGKILYQVRWKGFPPEEDTFEPIEHLNGCEELLDDYFTYLESNEFRPKARKQQKAGTKKGSGRASTLPATSSQRERQPERPRAKVASVKQAVGESLGVFASDESSSTDELTFTSDSEGPTTPIAKPDTHSGKPLLTSAPSSDGIQIPPRGGRAAGERPRKGDAAERASAGEKPKVRTKDRSHEAEPKRTQEIAGEGAKKTKEERKRREATTDQPKKAQATTDETRRTEAAGLEEPKKGKATASEEPKKAKAAVGREPQKTVVEEQKAPKKRQVVIQISSDSDESLEVETPPEQKASDRKPKAVKIDEPPPAPPEPPRLEWPTAADLIWEKAHTARRTSKKAPRKRKRDPRSDRTVIPGVAVDTEFDLGEGFPLTNPGPIPVHVFEEQSKLVAELVDPFPIRGIHRIKRFGKALQLLCELPSQADPVWLQFTLVEILNPYLVIAFLQRAECLLTY